MELRASLPGHAPPGLCRDGGWRLKSAGSGGTGARQHAMDESEAPQIGMEVDVVKPASLPDWDAQVRSLGDSGPFHSSGWASVLCESYGFQPSYFTGKRDGKLALVVPMMLVDSMFSGRRLVSLPFSDYCDPIYPPKGSIHPLSELIINYARSHSCKYVEWRCRQALFTNEPVWNTFYGHRIPLASEEAQLLSSFDDSTRRNIQKAKRSEVQIEVSTDLGALREFYRLHCRTRRDHGIPPQPFRFFLKIWENVLRARQGFIILARFRNEYIAASIFFHFCDKALYKFGAWDKCYQELRPNNGVLWEAIRVCKRRACSSLDLGRTDISDEGLRRFKLGWGAEEYVISYYRYDLVQGRFAAGRETRRASSRMLRKMPICLLRPIGALVYRHFA